MIKIASLPKPIFSIIILNYNQAISTLRCLKSINKHTLARELEIILWDNGSDRGQLRVLSAGLLKLRGLSIQLIKSNQNLGYARGNNEAAKLAKGDFLVFLNNDTVVSANWLPPLHLFLLSNPQVGACQPKLHSLTRRNYFDYAGGAGGFIDKLGYPFTRGRVFKSIEKDTGQYDQICEIEWAAGACLMIRRHIFNLIKGFDDFFFAYYEEIDLCVRIRQLGFQIFCIPSSVVYHRGALTSNGNLGLKIFLNHRNSLYFVLKHYSIWPHLPLILVRLSLDILAVIYYLLEFRFSYLWSIVRAYGQLGKVIPSLIRSGVITFYDQKSLETTFKGSIVFSHFILQKRSYQQIMGYSRQLFPKSN